MTIILATIVIVYLKVIRPQKRLYDIFRAQGINGEPFVPLIGQLPLLNRYRQADAIMDFATDLTLKHGNVFLFGFGPTTRLLIAEPDLLADVYSRANTENYIKPPIFNIIFTPIIGEQNLLVASGDASGGRGWGGGGVSLPLLFENSFLRFQERVLLKFSPIFEKFHIFSHFQSTLPLLLPLRAATEKNDYNKATKSVLFEG